MAFVDHCQTAEDVRRQAAIVRERRRTIFGSGNSLELEKFMLAYLQNQMEENKPSIAVEPPPVEVEVEVAPIEKLQHMPIQVTPKGEPKIKTIQEMVCKVFGIEFDDLLSGGRCSSLALPRYVVFVLARILTSLSLPEIGRRTGKRDHTTVLNGVKKSRWLTEQLKAELSECKDLKVWVARACELMKARNPRVFR